MEPAARDARIKELQRMSKFVLANMHIARGGLMPLADYLRWTHDELVTAVIDDESNVHRPN